MSFNYIQENMYIVISTAMRINQSLLIYLFSQLEYFNCVQVLQKFHLHLYTYILAKKETPHVNYLKILYNFEALKFRLMYKICTFFFFFYFLFFFLFFFFFFFMTNLHQRFRDLWAIQ